MSYRLQVLIPEELNAQLQKAAKRIRISKGEWVRRALAESVQSQPASFRRHGGVSTGGLERSDLRNRPDAARDRNGAPVTVFNV